MTPSMEQCSAPEGAPARRRARPVTPDLLRDWPLPTPSGTKFARGQAVVVGGSRGTPGAPLLSGEAALRMGAGRLTLAVPESVAVACAVTLREGGVQGLAEDTHGSISGEGAGPVLRAELERADGLLIGPGLDDADGSIRLVEELVAVAPADLPIGLDAFGFTVLPQLDAATRAALKGRTVANCNVSELGRLVDTGDLTPDRAGEAAVEVATRWGLVVSCHGWVVDDEGQTWHLGTGDTGLGTSGSGDVLAGAITGLLSRGAARDQAAVWAAHVHAAAGDTLAARFGRIGYLAGDLLTELPQVLSSLRGD